MIGEFNNEKIKMINGIIALRFIVLNFNVDLITQNYFPTPSLKRHI